MTFNDDMKAGRALLQNGDRDAAAAHFEGVADRFPQRPAPLRALLRISQNRGDPQAVRRYLGQILVLDPNAVYERALQALFNARHDIAATRAELPVILTLARDRPLTAHMADPIIRVIQYAATTQHRLAYLSQVHALLTRCVEQAEPDADTLPERLKLAELSYAIGDYDAVVAAAAALQPVSASKQQHIRIDALKRVADRITAPAFPDFAAEKVFGIGLSRTGTTSLNVALNMLGYHAIHWINPVTRDLIRDSDLAVFDAFSDIVISHQFEWLYHTFPNAKFILTTRAVDSWTTSVARHYRNVSGMTGPRELNQPAAKTRFRNAGGLIESNLYAHHNDWPDAHAAFHARVRAFFSDKPADKLLEMAIVAGDGWDVLCPFLGRTAPDAPFPVSNTAPKTG